MTSDDAPNILVADDHPLMLGALRHAVLNAAPDANIVEAADYDGIVSALDAHKEFDLVLLDLSMPGVRGLSGTDVSRVRQPAPGWAAGAQAANVPIIVVSANDDTAVMAHCLEFGAAAFMPKSLSGEKMREVIAIVLEGGHWRPPELEIGQAQNPDSRALVRRLASLTPQQVRVLMMLSQGLLNKQIAFELTVSEATVKAHVSAILTKLGVESRTQAVILAAESRKYGTRADALSAGMAIVGWRE